MSAQTIASATGARLVIDHDNVAGRLATAARDLLYAIDRGDFGDLRIGPPDDRAESAFVADLRLRVAMFDALAIEPSRHPEQQQAA